MNLPELILALRPLLDDPEQHGAEIERLLAAHADLAEAEVARFLVGDRLFPRLEPLLRDPDPRQRLLGLDRVKRGVGAKAAARAVRWLAKDPDPTVRGRAQAVWRHLALDDVALPDARIDPGHSLGHWNPYGWSFGVHQISSWILAKGKQPARPRTLEERGLPDLSDADAVAELVGVASADELVAFMRPGAEAGSGYVEFEIPKASGGARRIAAPRAPLRRVQRKLLDEILGKVRGHDASHGFVAGRSTVTNAAPHRGASLLVKLDLVDFFPSIHYRRVAGLFRWLGYGDDVAQLLARLTTYRPKLADGTVVWPGILPQGAPTSPALANLVARRLDARLAGLARRTGATYTRYADDLTFSFRTPPERGVGRFLWWVDQICQQEGFAANQAKRRILRRSSQQRVTGIVVNDGLSVPRAARRRFRAMLHNCRAHGLAAQARGREDFAAYLLGFAAYVRMVQPPLGDKWLAEVRALVGEGS